MDRECESLVNDGDQEKVQRDGESLKEIYQGVGTRKESLGDQECSVTRKV